MNVLFRLLREIYEYFWLYFGLLYFGIGGILYTLVSTVLHLLLPRRMGIWFGRWAIGMLFRSYLAMLRASGVLKLDLSVLDTLAENGGVIVAPNHPSLLDAVLIISRQPNIACIMKAEIWDSPVLGGGARLAGYIRNDSPANMVRLATMELQSGRNLLVFPEGTRTRTKPINTFKGGFALIAKKSAAPLQTVIIETDNPFLSKGWPILKKPDMPIVYRVRLGKRFQCTGDSKAFIAELEQYFQNTLTPDAVRKYPENVPEAEVVRSTASS